MNSSKITRQMDGWMESKMTGSKITQQNGCTDGELNEQLENNSPKECFLADIDPYFGELIRNFK